MGLPSRDVPAHEIARLEALRRLAMGAVHSLNNALAGAVGEASFLREERKEDPLVLESCDAILDCLDRCARITRALAVRRNPSQGAADEVDLGRLLRELGDLLGETLGRRHHLTLDLPDELLTVHGRSENVEVALLTLIHFVAEAGGEGAALRLSATRDRSEVRLRLDATCETPANALAATLRDPSLASDGLTRTCLDAFAALVSALGGSHHAEATGPDALAVSVRLPASATGD
jgi:C4-dicarboxylate-specific signal transduction histidine kinase